MAVTNVNNYTNLANVSTTNSSSSSSAITNATNDQLGKDAFLKLLIAELSNQDPTNPIEDREFISQMATFSELEQMQNMNGTLESMAESNKFSAVNYIGKAVAFTNSEGQQVPAVVNAVWFENGKAILDTTQGDIPLEQVEGVSYVN